jgi:lipid-binding SYLF domain-containing protein
MRLLLLVTLVGSIFFASATPAKAQDEKAQEVIKKFKELKPELAEYFKNAQGYAVFPSVGKGAIGVGGAHGNGFVYQREKLIGKTSLTQVTVGLQLGGQAYSEIVFLQDKAAMDSFKKGKLKLDAQASAVAVTARAGLDLPYRNGVAIATMAKGGLMYEASVGGQHFSFNPL